MPVPRTGLVPLSRGFRLSGTRPVPGTQAAVLPKCADQDAPGDDEDGAEGDAAADELGVPKEERREADPDERLGGDERRDDAHPAPVEGLEERDVGEPEADPGRHERHRALREPRPGDHGQQGEPAEQGGGRRHRRRRARALREPPDEVVARGEQHHGHERVREPDPPQVRGPVALARELHAAADDEHRADDERRACRLAEKHERDRHRDERRRAEHHRRARRAGLADRERREELPHSRLQETGERERPRGGRVHAAGRRLRDGPRERDDERRRHGRERPEHDVSLAVECEAERNAHPAEEHGGQQREADCDQLPSSTGSGTGAREKNGTKTCASGPMQTAYATVPTPTVPPSRKPITTTLTSSDVRMTRIECPRLARPVIKPSRGPGPSPAPMYAPVATPFRKTPTTRHTIRSARSCGGESCASTTSIVPPMKTTLLTVPIPGRSRSGIHNSSTNKPTRMLHVPMARFECLERPWWRTSHGLRPRPESTSSDALNP